MEAIDRKHFGSMRDHLERLWAFGGKMLIIFDFLGGAFRLLGIGEYALPPYQGSLLSSRPVFLGKDPAQCSTGPDYKTSKSALLLEALGSDRG